MTFHAYQLELVEQQWGLESSTWIWNAGGAEADEGLTCCTTLFQTFIYWKGRIRDKDRKREGGSMGDRDRDLKRHGDTGRERETFHLYYFSKQPELGEVEV